MNKTVVIIPCFNEADNLYELVNGIRTNLPNADIIVGDNNSTDKTKYVAEERLSVKVISEEKQGKGYMIRTLFKNVKDYDCVIMIDGDNTYSTEQLKEIEKGILEEGFDTIIGNRKQYFDEEKSFIHKFGNKIVYFITNLLYSNDMRIGDCLSGYRGFSKNFIQNTVINSTGFEIETELNIKSYNYKIRNILCDYQNRKDNNSKIRLKDGFRILNFLIRYYKYKVYLNYDYSFNPFILNNINDDTMLELQKSCVEEDYLIANGYFKAKENNSDNIKDNTFETLGFILYKDKLDIEALSELQKETKDKRLKKYINLIFFHLVDME